MNMLLLRRGNMKLGTKKGWKSLVQIRMGRKSATQFCMFPKVRSAGQTPGNAPVFLNVYDLTPVNGYMYWAGLGIFHSGIEGCYYATSRSLFYCPEVLRCKKEGLFALFRGATANMLSGIAGAGVLAGYDQLHRFAYRHGFGLEAQLRGGLK